MIELRPSQEKAIAALYDYWGRDGGNPLVEMATGTGKSIVIGKLSQDVLAQFGDMRILVLVHVRELVQQNAMALLRLWPSAPLGIYSAGLNRRDTHRQIIFASIQSVFRKGKLLGPFDLVLIDEAHLVPAAGEGMYRTLLDDLREMRPDMRVAGFTATPYRLDSGRLDEGAGKIFDQLIYAYGISDGIADAVLSPLISKATVAKLDVAGVGKRGGEFISGALEAAVDVEDVTKAAVEEIAGLGAERRSWLIFCSGVNHAHHVAEAFRWRGIDCRTIVGDTPSHERSRAIDDFKSGRLRALTNANVLTTGFDAPGVDLIAFLRPTLSTGLYVQMCGRGTRLAEGKQNCLVLDFAGNVRRHGPVDIVEVEAKRAKPPGEKEGRVAEERIAAKECPVCHSLNPLGIGVCRDCGHEWPVKAKHERHADAETPIFSGEPAMARAMKKLVPDEHPVQGWSATRHEKMGSPDSMKVTYLAGLLTFSEWIAFEHGGYPAQKAQRWWAQHSSPLSTPPRTVAEALDRFHQLRRPAAIQVRREGKWWTIVGRWFEKEERAA